MITSNNAHLSLTNLQNGPPKTLTDALQAAKKLISKRTGIISTVEFVNLASNEPSFYMVQSTPASNTVLNGMETMSQGNAASIDPKRAIMKAVGESIERYCPAHFKYEDFVLASYNDLDCEAVQPGDFALFSEKQYAEPDFPFTRLTDTTPLRWVSAYSITHDQPILVPASFVHIPYRFDPLHETPSHNPISTGLACGSNLAPAICKGIQEVIERDAFMIMWQNQLPCSEIDLSTVNDPFIQSMLNELKVLPAECQAYLLPSDIEVPVIMVLLRGTSDQFPHSVVGVSADLNPNKALILALEEVGLGWVGMGRYTFSEKIYKPAKDYQNINTVILHGIAHAMDPTLGKSLEFLNPTGKQISIQDIKNIYDENMVNNIRNLVSKLDEKGLNVIVKELTTVDVDEVGFKVTRVVIPGMQPLDVNHSRRYLGGTRLYEVPCQMGLRSRPLTEEEVNPYPHIFP
jgi:ribosomal protein S12 methylthiotransferase accessory factor